MRKLFPLLLALIGLGAGIGAGLMLKPAAEDEAAGSAAPRQPPDRDAGGEAAGRVVHLIDMALAAENPDQRAPGPFQLPDTLELAPHK